MLGERLKELRENHGKTQDVLADYLNVKRQTYSAYERNVSIPDAITLKKLADYFNCSTDYLLGRVDEPTDYYHKIKKSPSENTDEDIETIVKDKPELSDKDIIAIKKFLEQLENE